VLLAQSPELRRRLGSAAAHRATAFDISQTARIVEARYAALVRS
jgi:hypothetical protein